ncbi:unnamed protein product [Cyprideis torosa]|uniref:Uncharacterized protein n=1 Tax=Cyprideis torosa TaxID=163714 RepID=A0A7R8ZQX6_9CRUS|nr:unnamed protein product [Cyprideis torosa]CAG0891687.1 unnamed protein product [Cyprideis torosa]
MKFLSLLQLLLAHLEISQDGTRQELLQHDDAHGISASFRIVGGVEAKEAHCTFLFKVCNTQATSQATPRSIPRLPSNQAVVAGEHHIQTFSGDEVVVGVQRFITHPEYQGRKTSWANDIALAFLNDPLPLGHRPGKAIALRPGRLPDTDVSDGTPVTATGWGRIGWNKEFSTVLMKERQRSLPGYSNPPRTPSDEREKGTPWGLCDSNAFFMVNGDSGGPLVLTRQTDVVVGIVSWGVRCRWGKPNVYTNVRNATYDRRKHRYIVGGVEAEEGEHNTGEFSGDEVMVPVHSFIRHPKYTGGKDKSWSGDLALAILHQPLPLGPRPGKAIALKAAMLVDHQVPPGTSVTVTGWGRLGWHKGLPDVLRKVELAIVDSEECDKIYKNFDPQAEICAQGPTGETPCKGDSGGPLLLTDQPDVIVGVVSWGNSCDAAPSVYVNVS